MDISVATWNTEWATPSSDRGRRIGAILQTAGTDIAVVTEGVPELLPATGSVVDAGSDWGYGAHPARRKVIIWSRYPLKLNVASLEGATRGRLVVATAETPSGPVRIVGVCIPWRDAHVSTGRRDAQPWSEHLDYLDRLENLLAGLDDEVPGVVAGDFNQRIPRGRQPIRVANRLAEVLAGWTVHTAGNLPYGPHIDHIASNWRLIPEAARDWPASDLTGRLSDHAGVACSLRSAEAPTRETRDGSEPAVGPGQQGLSADSMLGPAPKHGSDLTRDGSAAAGSAEVLDGALAPELRAEIESVLRRSGDGLSHGATFRLWEEGLTDAQIAASRGVSLGTTRVFLRSLDALFTGCLPTTKSLALTNSYVYRELLNHPRSEKLDCYVKAQLRRLQEINSAVRSVPLQTRSHQYGIGSPEKAGLTNDSCAECAALGITHSGRC